MLIFPSWLLLHQNHFHSENLFDHLLHFLGTTHLFFLHFPIALVFTCVALDALFLFQKKRHLFQTTRVLIHTTTVATIPTVLSGLALGLPAQYTGIAATYFTWHLWLGVLILCFTILASLFREGFERKKMEIAPYYTCLLILFVQVVVTGYLGGVLSFGSTLLKGNL